MPERSYEEKHFIEDISLYFEQMGIPRMAGRILGVLLIANPPEQSIDDLCEKLQASKSSASTSARLLSEMGLIERAPSPHPRRIYFRRRCSNTLKNNAELPDNPAPWLRSIMHFLEASSGQARQITRLIFQNLIYPLQESIRKIALLSLKSTLDKNRLLTKLNDHHSFTHP